jgi:hypothetical protein
MEGELGNKLDTIDIKTTAGLSKIASLNRQVCLRMKQ